jgi:hypothetical protein
MTSLAKQYTKEFNKKYGGYFVAWDPGVKYQLGDYGKLKDKTVFERYGNIKDLGINFEETELSSPGNMVFKSDGVTQVPLNNESTMNNHRLPTGKTTVGIALNFKHEKSTIFEATGISDYGIRNIDSLGKELERLYNNHQWRLEYAIIVSIKKADSETVIITNQKNASVELKAEVDLDIVPSDITLSIADASINWKITKEKNCTYKLVTEGDLTPIFKLFGLKSKFPSRKPQAEYFGGQDEKKLNSNHKSPLIFKEIKP